MDEIKNEENKPETLQPVVEMLEPVVESLDNTPVESLDSSVNLNVPSEPVTEAQPGFIEINSGSTTEAATDAVAAPEVIKSVEQPAEIVTEPIAISTEPVTEASSETPLEAKEEPPKPLETKPIEKKKVSPVLIIVIILLIALGVAAGFFIAKSLSSKDGKDDTSSGTPSNVSSGSIDKVVYKGLAFDIPKNYSAAISDDILSIKDTNGVNFAISIEERSYSSINSNRDAFKSNFESQGYVTKDFVEKDVNGSKYLYLDIKRESNVRTFFRSIDSVSTFVGVIVREDEAEVKDEDLDSIEKILVTARADTTSRGLSGSNGQTTSFDEIFDILRDRSTDIDNTQNSDEVTDNTNTPNEAEPVPTTPEPTPEPEPTPAPESVPETSEEPGNPEPAE